MTDIAHDNHFVPRGLLRRWSTDATHLEAYRLLVSHANVPLWDRRALKSVANQSDLYTSFDGQDEVDDFERWIGRKFETPALEVVAKLESGGQLSPTMWKQLIKFVALQDMRTPSGFIEFVRNAGPIFNSHLESVVADFNKSVTGVAIDTVTEGDTPARAHVIEPNVLRRDGTKIFGDSFRVRFEPPSEPGGMVKVIPEVKSSRSLWMESTRTRMEGRGVDILCGHRWSVVAPHGEFEWPITDRPVLKMNYWGPTRYTFHGGYGNAGSEIMMPISPTRLLYTQVGSNNDSRFTATEERTREIQRLLVERAFRWVFVRTRADWVVKVRPREVNPHAYAAEQDVLNQWHSAHGGREAEFYSSKAVLTTS